MTSSARLPSLNHLALFYLTLLPAFLLSSSHPSSHNSSLLSLSLTLSLQNSPLFQYLHDLGHTDFEACPTASQEEEYGGAEGDLDSPDEDPRKTRVSLCPRRLVRQPPHRHRLGFGPIKHQFFFFFFWLFSQFVY